MPRSANRVQIELPRPLYRELAAAAASCNATPAALAAIAVWESLKWSRASELPHPWEGSNKPTAGWHLYYDAERRLREHEELLTVKATAAQTLAEAGARFDEVNLSVREALLAAHLNAQAALKLLVEVQLDALEAAVIAPSPEYPPGRECDR